MPETKPRKPSLAELDRRKKEDGELEKILMAIGRAIAPSSDYFAVTPHNSQNFQNGPCKALYVGGAGNLVAVNELGEAITFTAVPAGTILPIQAKRVNATNTTATAIVAL